MFPPNPSDGQEETLANGVTYKWNDTLKQWLIVSSGGGGGGPPVDTDNTAPATPPNGTLWYDQTNMRLMMYIGVWFQVA